MNEWIELIFACSYMVPGKLKVTLGMHMVKNLLYLKNKSMNWADFLHAGSDIIIFG